MNDAATTLVVTPVSGVATGGYLDFMGMSVQGITHSLLFGSAEILLATPRYCPVIDEGKRCNSYLWGV
jgi:hypothetical protein